MTTQNKTLKIQNIMKFLYSLMHQFFQATLCIMQGPKILWGDGIFQLFRHWTTIAKPVKSWFWMTVSRLHRLKQGRFLHYNIHCLCLYSLGIIFTTAHGLLLHVYIWAMSQENLSSGFFHQVILQLACSATETSWSLESLDFGRIGIILSRQWKTKALIRLRRCAGWPAPFLFTYSIKQVFSWWGSSDIFEDL